MQDREHRALLQQDDDPERQKSVYHPINRSGQYGHHLQTRGGVVTAMLSCQILDPNYFAAPAQLVRAQLDQAPAARLD
jgi:hypothetical protein